MRLKFISSPLSSPLIDFCCCSTLNTFESSKGISDNPCSDTSLTPIFNLYTYPSVVPITSPSEMPILIPYPFLYKITIGYPYPVTTPSRLPSSVPSNYTFDETIPDISSPPFFLLSTDTSMVPNTSPPGPHIVKSSVSSVSPTSHLTIFPSLYIF